METCTQNDLRFGLTKARCSAVTKLFVAAGLIISWEMSVAMAGNVSLNAADAAGSSSYNTVGHWNNSALPSVANNYFTTNFTLRTPAPTTSGNNYVFGGNSLSIDPGGRFLSKIGNNAGGNTTTASITVNLILNGGMFDQAGANNDNSALTVLGSVSVNATSLIGALGSTANGSTTFFETVEFAAPISGSGTLLVSGAGINAGADTGLIKLSAANPYSGTITVSNGVNNTIASAINRILQLNNQNALSNATLNLNSSQASPVSFASAANTGPFNIGVLTGTANQTLMDTASSPITLSVGGNNGGGTYAAALTDGGSLVKVGSGTLTLTGTNTYSGNTTVNGGSLQLGNGGVGGALSSSSTLTINANLTIKRTNAVVQGIDFSGNPITGTGSFTQAGGGMTILNAANNYSGPTAVNSGKLVMSTIQASTGALTVANGAKLDVAVSGSSQLQPGTLTLGTSAATILEFDNLNSTVTAPLNVGTLSVGGSVTVNINTGTFAAGNSYPLIHWTATGPADASSFTLGVSPGLTANFSVSGSTLYLNVSAVSDIWAGTINGNWDTSTANWTGNATVFANGQAVLLDDTAANPSITVTTPVQPGGITVNNNTLAYTINSSGTNNISGSGGLTMLNIGTLTLSGGANTYTGVTTVNNGILSVAALANGGSASDIGAASSASANIVLNGGTLQYTGGPAGTDHGATLGAGGGVIQVSTGGTVLTNSGVIVGTGSLTTTGNGTLTLTGASTFSGGVNLSAGQLNINNGGSSSANSAIGVRPLAISANTIIDNTSGSDVTLLPNNAQVWAGNFTYSGSANSLNLGTGPVSLPTTSIVTVNGNTLTVGGAVSGIGGLTKMGSGTLVLLNASTFSGTVDLQVGTLTIGNDLALGTGLLNFDGGTTGSTIQSVDGTAHTITNAINFNGANANAIFGGTGNLKFTATPTANGTAKTLTVNNPQTEFSGVLGGASARTVAGTGTLILSGANNYTAGTTINPGATLQLGNGSTNGSLSTSGVIDDEGTLKFNRSDAIVQGIHFAIAPIIGSGSVVQAGPGITTLNAANIYTGPTTVNNGELFITPAFQGGGDVFVSDGAKFGISANSVSNSATIGNLNLGSSGTTALDFSYGLTGNPTNAAIVAGAVTINGISTIRIGGSFVPGTFPVLKYGSLSGAFVSTVVGPRGVTATLVNDTINKVLNVTVSAVGNGIVWSGTNAVSPNLWDLNLTTNWLIGGLPTVYLETVPPGDAVTFNDQGNGLVLLSNTASPASVTISNTSVNYSFQGPGQINSVGGLTKVGAGTVTLNLPGTFGGSSVISNGTLSITANQTLANLSGNSAVTAPTGTPTLTVNDSVNTAYSGNLSGTLSLALGGTSQLTIAGSSNNVSGSLFVDSGALLLNSAVMTLSNYCSVGRVNNDNGTLTLKGTTTLTESNDFNVGDSGASIGTLNVQDTASLTVNSFYIGSANSTGSTASGTVNQTGGTVSELNGTDGTFCIGGRATTTSVSGVGIYNLSGGTLSAIAGIRVGSVGQGTFNQSGGTVIANGDVDIARIAGATGTYNLDGGTLKTISVVSSAGVNGTLNFNGGLLVALRSSTAFITNLTVANVRNGGVIVDTTNFTVTVSQPLVHSSIGGDNAIDGGLTKLGAGALTLTGAGSSYTGPTVVTAGALNLSPNSVPNLNAATLNNAALGLGLGGGTTTFSATSLTLAGNSALNFNYGLVSSTPITALSAGNLTASGTTVINVNGYGFAVGQFPLVAYTGTPLANLSHFALGALPAGVTANLSNNVANSSIDLVVTAVTISTWIPLVISDPVGTSSFNTAGFWQDGNPPTAGNGYYTALQLRSPADNAAYTFGGSVLAIDTGGRFLLKGTNGQSITVPSLVLSGGLLDYANTADNLTESFSGNITLAGATTSFLGALSSSTSSETFFENAPISGTGNLQLGGSNINGGSDNGVVVLGATNTYTGATTVASGTVLVNGANGSSAITVNANATLGGTGSIAGPVTVLSGGTLAPGIPTQGALTAAIGTLTVSAPVTIGGTVLMKIDRSATPSSARLNASAVTVNPGATLTVNNLGSTNFVAGDTFTLFSAPISGSFSALNLPVLPGANFYWTNNLAVNGSIAVASTSTINPNPTNIVTSISGGNLTLSWPTDHTGWTLQAQTNTLGTGLGVNWVDVAGSNGTNAVVIPISAGNGAVFYRLRL